MAKLPLGRKDPKIGPSDSSDTFSDRPFDPPTDSDDGMTGERAAPGLDPESEVHAEEDADRVVGPLEAGVAGGLDEAEEADVDPLGVPREPRPGTRVRKRRTP
jgi:hypothetical protein